MRKRWFCILLSLLLLCGCAEPSPISPPDKTADALKASILSCADRDPANLINEAFLTFLSDTFGDDVLDDLHTALTSEQFTLDDWYTLTGNTANVLLDRYSGALDKNSPRYRNDITVINSCTPETIIRVVGDVSFADNWHIAPKIGQNGVLDVMSEETLALLKNADICLVNNEFTYSTRGKPLNKAYTFRAHPDNVQYMLDIGADVVSLANNHAYDYGADAFADTLETLKNAGLPYVGGGADIKEAAKPHYFIVNGRKYAVSAATRAEKTIRTPEAGENTSGVMRTYDAGKYLETIKTAEQQCDYNIVYVHWGAEGSHRIEDGLYEMACEYIDAGADIVIGAHTHVLQGVRFYKDVPIVFNLGNFLFNAYNIDTGILEVVIDEHGIPNYRFVPAIQRYCSVKLVHDEQKQRILDMMTALSTDVCFETDGTFYSKAG